jgi:hypothetical protein
MEQTSSITGIQRLPAGSYNVSVVNSTPGACNASSTVNITLSGGDILLVTTNPAATCGYADLTSATIIARQRRWSHLYFWLNPKLPFHCLRLKE